MPAPGARLRTGPLGGEPHVFLSAGEVSGDRVGALLAAELLRRRPQLRLSGIGGSRMAEAGVQLVADTTQAGVVGVTEAVPKIPFLYRVFTRVRGALEAERPEAAVLIGNDIFNVILGRWLRRRGIPTISYFPPQVWLWAALARLFARSFDVVLTSFPEEEEVYSRAGAQTVFVGHYLCDLLGPAPEAGLAPAAGQPPPLVVGLLPGSREQEVKRLGPGLLDAAKRLLADSHRLRLLLPVADPTLRATIDEQLERSGLAGAVEIRQLGQEVIREADLVLTASGTATLEAALLGKPMVAVFRVSVPTRVIVRLAYLLGLLRTETVALPNLVLGRAVVAELGQSRCDGEHIAAAARELIDDDDRRAAMAADLGLVRARLERPGSIERACAVVLERMAHGERRGIGGPSAEPGRPAPPARCLF